MCNKLKISTYDYLRAYLIVKFNYDRKRLFTIVNDRFWVLFLFEIGVGYNTPKINSREIIKLVYGFCLTGFKNMDNIKATATITSTIFQSSRPSDILING